MCSNNISQDKKLWFTDMYFFEYLFSSDFKYIPSEIYNTYCLEFQVSFKSHVIITIIKIQAVNL